MKWIQLLRNPTHLQVPVEFTHKMSLQEKYRASFLTVLAKEEGYSRKFFVFQCCSSKKLKNVSYFGPFAHEASLQENKNFFWDCLWTRKILVFQWCPSKETCCILSFFLAWIIFPSTSFSKSFLWHPAIKMKVNQQWMVNNFEILHQK